MSDDVPARVYSRHAWIKEEETKKRGRRAQKTTRTLVLVFLRKETVVVVVVGRATGTREVDNENIFWLKLRFL